MKLFAHDGHVYEDRARHGSIEWAIGQVREVPDDIGQLLLSAHDVKFCDVTSDGEPEAHKCAKDEGFMLARSERAEAEAAMPNPIPGSGRIASGRREIQRAAYRRSSVARANRG